ncbi:MAG: carbamoyltransferase family protein [Gammaproteobacteria bacterium]
MKKYYIGLSATYHDPALAIVDDNGDVLFAEATERFLQDKRALNCPPDQLLQLPGLLREHCRTPCEFEISLNWRKKRPPYEKVAAGLGLLSAPGLMRRGFKRLRSPLENYKLHHMIACQRQGIAAAGVNLVRILREYYPGSRIAFSDYEHHDAHAAAACYSSPFEEAACAVIDSFGENGSMAFYHFLNGRLQRIHETRGTGSLGFYYMKITELCGFDWLKGEEWKVMGLAPYGKLDLEFYDCLQAIVEIDGFDVRHRGGRLFRRIDELEKFRRRNDQPVERAADLAYTGQYFFAELMTGLLKHLREMAGSENLALAGGCALNSSFNGQIVNRTGFGRVHVPSAPADDGTALGAAWLAFRRDHPDAALAADPLQPYLGSSLSGEALERLVEFNRALNIRHLPDGICEAAAELLAQGRLVGWVQGRAEFGPRALGNRSILADPRNASVKDKINRNIKFREKFRPFAPSILPEYGGEYFVNYQESPYMDKTLTIRPDRQDRIAAACHVDGTGRLQTVKKEWNPKFHRLIECFYRKSGVPALLNTSFNVMGKPLVHSVEDAVAVFMTTGLDVLVIGDYLVTKERDE